MNMFLIFITLIVFILLLIVIWYNSFVRRKAIIDEAWSGIDVQLKRRYDLIPNLVSVVKGYAIHEKNVLEEVTRMRSAAMNATQLQDKVTLEAGLTQALKTLFAVAEQYPNLKANENFLSLQKDLSFIEHEIQLARRYYNGATREYNITITKFPANIIATLFGFTKAPYFELDVSRERDVPKINF
ncbi:MAG TPA: LemA family protein [Candidatus Babeliales bacterium]|nr:LemA family protein [Candidatus Babeliales bacterium]